MEVQLAIRPIRKGRASTGNTDDQAGKLKDCEMLREEIMHHDRPVPQLLSVMPGFIGVITAQGITARSPHAAIIPLPLLLILRV